MIYPKDFDPADPKTMQVDLPYPHKVLWPNGRTRNEAYKRRLQKLHKTWAFEAAGCGTKRFPDATGAKIKLIVSPMPKGPPPDKDNCISAVKYYLDGISAAIGINDRFFSEPEVVFAERKQYGNMLIEVTI